MVVNAPQPTQLAVPPNEIVVAARPRAAGELTLPAIDPLKAALVGLAIGAVIGWSISQQTRKP